ncbi:MAG: ATP-binding protein [Pseudomonadota bacterium]
MARMRINDEEIKDAEVFEIIVEHFPDIIQSVDSQGNILFANRQASRLLGYSREELLSMNIRQIYADEILEQVEKGFKELKEKGEKRAIESLLKSRDGERIPVEIRSYSIYDDQNNFVRTFSIIRDIREIKELQNSLIHAGRLTAIGEMASSIVHDIRNPVNTLFIAYDLAMLNLEKIRGDDTEAFGPIEKALKNMKRGLEVINNLAEQLTNFCRGMAESHEVVDLNAIMTDALFLTRTRMNHHHVTLDNRIENRKYYTKGAFNQLEQVFVNLIANACDAMGEKGGGSLTLSFLPCRRCDVDCWKCDISDTGAGIPEESLEKIYQSFYTTKEKGKGTGLGLSIARGIIKNHEGEIEVRSVPGKGATFSIFLQRLEP